MQDGLLNSLFYKGVQMPTNTNKRKKRKQKIEYNPMSLKDAPVDNVKDLCNAICMQAVRDCFLDTNIEHYKPTKGGLIHYEENCYWRKDARRWIKNKGYTVYTELPLDEIVQECEEKWGGLPPKDKDKSKNKKKKKK